jgi:hypothetical protein
MCLRLFDLDGLLKYVITSDAEPVLVIEAIEAAIGSIYRNFFKIF